MAKNEKSLSLVELMITVAILSSGLVLILRSFLSSASILDSMSNRIKAYEDLNAEANILEERSLVEQGITEGDARENIQIGLHPAEQETYVKPLLIEGLDESGLGEAKITIAWKESGKDQDATLSAYYLLKK